ncbi:MAG: nucleoside triphosphate pyrophosphatase [Pseudomonadota bacterium]
MQNLASPPIVLASSSAYRRELLNRVLRDFETVSPNVDESRLDGEDPAALVARLARDKAEAVSARFRDGLIIGADQIAVLDERILGKPGDHATAVDQLMAASGKTVRFLTAVCVLDSPERLRYEHIDETIVRFRRFDRRLADVYLHHDEPYDCAGSFRVEGAGVVLFDAVETEDPTALIGLPMIWLSARLLELGCLLPGAGDAGL